VKPNKDNIQLWVQALRSGKYKQAKATLKSASGGYCCLGVACRLFGEVAGKRVRFRLKGPGVTIDGQTYTQELLPLPVAEWLGMMDEPGDPYSAGERDPQVYDDNGSDVSLTDLNDSDQDFPSIAVRIEAKWLSEEV
jgi:hypothetical protein